MLRAARLVLVVLSSVLCLAACTSTPPSANVSKRDALAEQVLSGKGEPYDVSFDKVDGKTFVFVVDAAEVDGFITPPDGYQPRSVVQTEPSPADGTIPVARFSKPGDSSPQCEIVVLRLADPSRYPDKMPDEVKRSDKTLVLVRIGC